MTSQPPMPPGGPGQPGPGEQPQQPWGQQPAQPQQPWGQQPPPPQQQWGQQPAQGGVAQPGYGAPGPAAGTHGVAFDATKLTRSTYALAGLTLLFLILSLFTWYSLDEDFFGAGFTARGWANGDVKLAFFLFLLATLWAGLPAVTEITLGFPRSVVTVALTALGFVFALMGWIDTFDELLDFSFVALLGALTAAAILFVALLSLLPELRNRPALPGPLGGAVQWANQPAAGPGQPPQPYGQAPPQQPYQQPYGQQPYQQQPYQQQPFQPGQPPQPGTPPMTPPPPPPAAPGPQDPA